MNNYIKLNELSKEIREEISEIYKDNVAKIRQTYAVTKNLYKNEIESNNLICPICSDKIDKGFAIHAKVHDFCHNGVYWQKDNLMPMHKECHEKEDIETYLTSKGEIKFRKSQQEKPYREYLKDPDLD